MRPDEWFFFDRNRLVALAEARCAEYAAAAPFPSIVLDEFLPAGVAARIAGEFPRPGFAGYRQPDNEYQKNKLGRVQESYLEGVPPFIRHVLNEFNGLAFMDFLEALTGIRGVIPDPHFTGGALHQILPGGRLDVHADFSRDPRRGLDRRINVLVYFNPQWKDEYGGHLELWDGKMRQCVRRIAPVSNRCVVFNTTSTSFHGHPDPLACPQGMTRNSIALYYYTNGRDDGVVREHSTLWQKRPGEKPAWKRAIRKLLG